MSRDALRAVVAAWCLFCSFVGCPAAAMAQSDPMTSELCSDRQRACAVQIDSVVRESASYPVTVRGAAGSSISVQAYRVKLGGGQIATLVPYSAPRQVQLNGQGVASVNVGLPALPADQTGGFILVSLAGMKGTDVSQMVGSFAVLGAVSPMLLGDGYGEQKPVGQVLDLQYYAAIAANRFAVDQQGDDGSWHDVTSSSQPGDLAMSPDTTGHVRYTVPRGLQQKSYQFRLRNTTVNRVVASWSVIPSLSPASQTRAGVWVPPGVGTAIGNTLSVRGHDSGRVKLLASGLTAACLVICAVCGISGLLRRRRLGWGART